MPEVEVCGKPEMRLNPSNGSCTLRIQLHTTDPEDPLHAVICILLHPASGRFACWPEWYG